MGVPQGDKPPEIEPLLRAAPRIKQVYWCKFPLAEHQHKPEFSSTAEKPERPVVVLSRQSTRRGVVTVVPLTRADQKDPHRSGRIKSPSTAKKLPGQYAITSPRWRSAGCGNQVHALPRSTTTIFRESSKK